MQQHSAGKGDDKESSDAESYLEAGGNCAGMVLLCQRETIVLGGCILSCMFGWKETGWRWPFYIHRYFMILLNPFEHLGTLAVDWCDKEAFW